MTSSEHSADDRPSPVTPAELEPVSLIQAVRTVLSHRGILVLLMCCLLLAAVRPGRSEWALRGLMLGDALPGDRIGLRRVVDAHGQKELGAVRHAAHAVHGIAPLAAEIAFVPALRGGRDDGQEERQNGEDEVPAYEEAAAFLHLGRVNERGGGQPD